MSQSDYILKSLNLKDKNIKFYENYLTEEIIKEKRSLIYHAYLSYIPEYCPICGCIMNSNIVKHGYKLSRIKMPDVSKLNTYLYLDKQRYKCRNCNHTFTCESNVINYSCFISNNTKHSIALDLTDKSSEKDIAKRNNVSPNTVERIIDSYYESIKIIKNYLPEYLSFDEFKSVKSADGNMSFNMCNAKTGKTIDIVENRQLDYLIKYFTRYTHAARNNVKAIVIDMYSPYITLIKKLFPNASIVIDKFHIIQLLSRSLNKTRIKLMSKDKSNYNKLKRYWKLILKPMSELNSTKWQRWTCFSNQMTESDVIDYLLNIDTTFKNAYSLYQNLLSAIQNKDKNKLNIILSNQYPNISEYMKTSIKTIIKFKHLIFNTFDINISNGHIEGNNNLIKTIKRIAFGFKSFLRFKARIMIVTGLLKLNEKSTQTLCV